MLAIGGVDPGGGAGLAADVRAIAAAGAFACPVAATLTVQSTSGLSAQRAVASDWVLAQARAVLEHQRVACLKTGALGSAANVRAVALLARAHPQLPLVVDPVRLPSRGKIALMSKASVAVVRQALVPCSTLVVANADEATALTGIVIRDGDSAKDAARAIVDLGARAALVKGGHWGSVREAVDMLALRGGSVRAFALPRVRIARGLHGGGCVLASMIAARLASTSAVTETTIIGAVRWAKRRHGFSLSSNLLDVGGAALVLAP